MCVDNALVELAKDFEAGKANTKDLAWLLQEVYQNGIAVGISELTVDALNNSHYDSKRWERLVT